MQDILHSMIKSISSVLIIFLIVQTLHAQEYFRSNNVIIKEVTYNNLPEADAGRKIFHLMASENNVNVQKFVLLTKSRIFLSISRNSDNNLIAKISLTRVNIDEKLKLHDFDVDSLLWPSGYTALLTLNIGEQHNFIKIEASTDGIPAKINLDNYLTLGLRNINATITNIKFTYSDRKFIQLRHLSKTISYYYSFGILLNNLIVNQSQNRQNGYQSVENILINKVIVDRVNNNIKTHNFIQQLNLEAYDPIGFISLLKRLQRLSNRTETLFTELLSNNKSDKKDLYNFCNLYCNISSNYLIKASTLQPSDAYGFEDVAKIYPSINAKNNLMQIINFYAANKHEVQAKMSQIIFNKFVNLANYAVINKNYTEALLMLHNSYKIHDWFNIRISRKFTISAWKALAGVANAYLRVGNMALSVQNNELANTYFNKADNLIVSNAKIFKQLPPSDTIFQNYFRVKFDIEIKYINNKQFRKALKSLDFISSIDSKLSSSNDYKLIDSASCLAYSGIITQKLDSLNALISISQYPDAEQLLPKIYTYIYTNSCNFNTDSIQISKLAYSLFLEFLQQGEILIDAQQSKMALYKLLIAKSIQQKYLSDDLIELDRLIKYAAEPVIKKIIDEAAYHTWANRMDTANVLYYRAVKLNNMYFQNSNSSINDALATLENKMKLRKCLSYSTKYDDLINKINIDIKYYNLSKLGEQLNAAQQYAEDHGNCKISTNEVVDLRNKYNDVLIFYQKYTTVKNTLFNKGYKDVIEKYILLLDYYAQNNLTRYKIILPDIKTFITKQKLLDLTMATAQYYIINGNLNSSFEYVTIYKNQGGTPKSIAYITNSLAKQLALRDDENEIPIKEALHKYTGNDSWYNNFKVSYLRYRIVK